MNPYVLLPHMLRLLEGRTKSEPGLSAKKSWRPVTAGLRSWREQVEASDVTPFEAATGPLLDELGYERAANDVSGAEVASAARLRDSLAGHARTRLRSVPGAWEGLVA